MKVLSTAKQVFVVETAGRLRTIRDVLRAMDVGDDLAHSSIRFGIGRFTTEEEVDYAANQVIETVKKLREMSPLYEMVVEEGIDLSTVNWQGGH